jgi:isochorismate synthase EntC
LADSNEKINFFGGLCFDYKSVKEREWQGFHDMYFVLPIIQLKMVIDEGKSELYQTECQINYPREIVANKNEYNKFLKKIDNCFTQYDQNRQLSNIEFKENDFNKKLDSKKDKWKKKIESCLEAIKNEDLEKVVLARKRTTSIEGDTTTLLDQLLEELITNKNSYLILIRPKEEIAFISNSPERLFKRESSQIEIDSIAGTRPRGKNSKLDKELENDLLNSKNIEITEKELEDVNEIFSGESTFYIKDTETLIPLKLKFLKRQ